jgi:hypothetical protein
MCIKIGSRNESGASLTEVMVATLIGSILFLVLAGFSFYSARSFVAMGNYADLDNASRSALDLMTREIRQVDHLKSYTSNATQISLEFAITNQTLKYTYFVDNQKLTRTFSGKETTLLTGVEDLSFLLFQRNTIANQFNQFPAATQNITNTTKLIQMRWKCARSIFAGDKANTESVYTAKIVIRKQ